MLHVTRIVGDRSRAEESGEWVWARVGGLRPGATLALRVAAGLSPYSDPLFATTLSEGERPTSHLHDEEIH